LATEIEARTKTLKSMNTVADIADTALIQKIFQSQKENQFRVASCSVKERKAKLRKLKGAVEKTYRQEIREALKKDFGKPQAEVDLTEVYPVISELKHAIQQLDNWMENQYVKTPLAFLGSSSYIKYEPKGVCLIISPWNVPLNLTFGPLTSAIAAGNTVIIKPSEYTPHISALMKKIISSLFPENEVCIIEGGVGTSVRLLELPFNHIFFTGSPSIGKKVMEAAAKNLASVTLELGGKSPTIVDETADIAVAARRTVWAKFVNAGQICIAPDYVLVHESKKQEFVSALKKNIENNYGVHAADSADYTRMVNEHHTGRMVTYIQDAALKGATIHGGKSDDKQNYIQPTIVTDAPLDCNLMCEEIFGPVLPVVGYQSLGEAIAIINSKEKPLALYIYSKRQKNIDHIISNTRAGGTCINHNSVNFFNVNLPFGGSNNSGIGKAHGFFGFEAFSNARSVYRQHIPGALELLSPPYTKWKERLIEWTVKYF
jgi:aldehyde dehydrogenase (NAD+)